MKKFLLIAAVAALMVYRMRAGAKGKEVLLTDILKRGSRARLPLFVIPQSLSCIF